MIFIYDFILTVTAMPGPAGPVFVYNQVVEMYNILFVYYPLLV